MIIIRNILIIILVFELFSCSPENFVGTYRSEDGSFLKLESGMKFQFGIYKYPELFTGIFKTYGNSIEIIFRSSFFGRECVTTLSMSMEKGEIIRISKIDIDADNLEIIVDKLENKCTIILDDEKKVIPLNSQDAENRLGIFYKISNMVFKSVDN